MVGFSDFVLDFFFGPCLDDSAVDPRMHQPRPREHPQRSSRELSQRQPRPQQGGSARQVTNHREQNGRRSSRQLNAIPEDEVQHDNNLRSSGNGGHMNGSTVPKIRRDRTYYSRGSAASSAAASSAISSLSDSFQGNRRQRRDDVSVISASLNETYRGYIENDDDYLDEQTVIRRSLKDAHKNTKKGQPAQSNGRRQRPQSFSDSSQASERTKLENWIENKGKPKSPEKQQSRGKGQENGTSQEWDNVTTISKASKNPYRVLGISQSASPKEIYASYKRRLRETEKRGGSDKAFDDVGNAYRRIRADMLRQEARRERRRSEGSGGKKKRGKGKHPSSSSSDEESDAISRRESVDARLRDHRELVEDLFAKDNKSGKKKRRGPSSTNSVSSKGQVTTLAHSVQSQSQALSEMNLVPIEAGAANVNEKKETIQNSCFYLSLAASYLSGVGAFVEDPTAKYYLNTIKNMSSNASVATVEMEIATLGQNEKQLTMNLALQLKRAIEAAVLLVHPDWAKSGMVGEEVQAFSDFLVYALDSDSVLGHWAIAVFDEASGFVDVYRGRHYGKVYPATKVKVRSREGKESRRPKYRYKYKDCDEATRRANTLTLRYVPGHYQPLLPELTKMAEERRQGIIAGYHARPALEDVVSTLEKWNVLHVVTDGRA